MKSELEIKRMILEYDQQWRNLYLKRNNEKCVLLKEVYHEQMRYLEGIITACKKILEFDPSITNVQMITMLIEELEVLN